MIRFRSTLALLFLGGFLLTQSQAQTPAGSGARSDAADLLSLSKKIDEQNIKIDLLSQQILRLQQEIEHSKSSSSSITAAPGLGNSMAPAPAGGGATHVVARGETLTSIAKMHKVGIDELQKFNHIENDRKLQIGQTLVIPGTQNASPSASPSPSPPND
jgi:LysM repeat protein